MRHRVATAGHRHRRRAAGLSNEAFYRYFASKDALVAAILEDGTERLGSYVAHGMEGEATPEGKVRRWVEGVLSQAADDDIASTTLAVLWNAGSLGSDLTSGPPFATGPLATLLRQPFADLGSPDPDLDASLAAHATVGMLADWLWKRVRPTAAEIDRVVALLPRRSRLSRHGRGSGFLGRRSPEPEQQRRRASGTADERDEEPGHPEQVVLDAEGLVERPLARLPPPPGRDRRR